MRFLMILSLTALPAMAANPPLSDVALPTLTRVTGVASGDKLNIRAAPEASSSVLGELPPGAGGVEVLARKDGWYLVNTAERSGWVNGRYLTLQTDPWADGALPETLHCIGTEPFWSLRRQGDRLVYSTPEDQSGVNFPIKQVLGSGVSGDRQRTVLSEGLTAFISPAQCSDQMSDRAYALGVTLVLGTLPEASQRQGCCLIAP